MNNKKKKELSRFISKLLRHQPEIANIDISINGWTNTLDFIKKINKVKYDRVEVLTMNLLEEIVREDEKCRYSFNNDKSMIRANQGHTIKVTVEMEEVIPPKYLYHGTSDKNIESIDRLGLLKMERLFVHLSGDVDTAYKVGLRKGRPYIYLVESLKMYNDGYKFFISSNGVWQIDAVPPQYLVKIGYIK